MSINQFDRNVWLPVEPNTPYELRSHKAPTFDVAAKHWDASSDTFRVVRHVNCRWYDQQSGYLSKDGVSITKKLGQVPIAVMVIELPKLDYRGKMLIETQTTTFTYEPMLPSIDTSRFPQGMSQDEPIEIRPDDDLQF